MIVLPVRLRRRAEQDVELAIDHLRDAAGQAVALAFVEDLRRTLDTLSRHPASGSPRHGHELGLPGLRHGDADITG